MLGKIPLPTTKAGTSLSVVTPWSQSSCAQEPWDPGKTLRVSKTHEDRENEATVWALELRLLLCLLFSEEKIQSKLPRASLMPSA